MVMKIKNLYEAHVESFKTYARKHSKEDLYDLFKKWAVSNKIYGILRHKIWEKVRHLRPKQKYLIKKDSIEYHRISEVVDVLHRYDLLFLEKCLNKNKPTVKTV